MRLTGNNILKTDSANIINSLISQCGPLFQPGSLQGHGLEGEGPAHPRNASCQTNSQQTKASESKTWGVHTTTLKYPNRECKVPMGMAMGQPAGGEKCKFCKPTNLHSQYLHITTAIFDATHIIRKLSVAAIRITH
jgi:hypothetical protein